MTIVVTGIEGKALARLMQKAEDCETTELIDFSAGYFSDSGELKIDTFLKNSDWRVTTGNCAGKEFVEIKNRIEEKFMFVLMTGEFDAVTIA